MTVRLWCSAAGKTTLADALAEMVQSITDRPVIRASIDDFGWFPRRSTPNGVRAFILESQRQWREGGSRRTLAIRLENTRTLVGGCETRLRQDGSAEVSWWTFPEHRRKGSATRAVRLMLQYFSNTVGITRFLAFIEPDNDASRGVARNAGFIESGLDSIGPRPMLRHEYSG